MEGSGYVTCAIDRTGNSAGGWGMETASVIRGSDGALAAKRALSVGRETCRLFWPAAQGESEAEIRGGDTTTFARSVVRLPPLGMSLGRTLWFEELWGLPDKSVADRAAALEVCGLFDRSVTDRAACLCVSEAVRELDEGGVGEVCRLVCLVSLDVLRLCPSPEG